jgi:DNA-binding response OmpR family regulator
MDQIRVILVEDDKQLSDSLTNYLSMSGFDVTPCSDSLSFYASMKSALHDIAVIDLGLPDQSGETLIEFLRNNTNLPMVVITARDTLEARINCYKLGADLFLSKPVIGAEIAAALKSLSGRAAKNGSKATSSGLLGNGTWTLVARERSLVSPQGKRILLTAKEWSLFFALANTQTSVTRAKLLSLIYRRDDESAQHALDTLIRRSRIKISSHGGHDIMIINDYGIGYRFAGDLNLA